jgi:hypothetical protein
MSAERFPYKLKEVHELIGYSPLVFDAKFFGEGDLKKVGGHVFQDSLPRQHSRVVRQRLAEPFSLARFQMPPPNSVSRPPLRAAQARRAGMKGRNHHPSFERKLSLSLPSSTHIAKG